MTQFATNPILTFQGADSVGAFFTQGDAIGLG